MYEVEKVVDGFSTCFRQHKATHTHCSLLHGYAIKFKLTFRGETLNQYNWLVDFGFITRDGLDSWFKKHFDHTLLVAKDDPCLELLKELHKENAANIIVLDNIGCEYFAQYVFEYLKSKSYPIHKVTCIENDKNSASYFGT